MLLDFKRVKKNGILVTNDLEIIGSELESLQQEMFGLHLRIRNVCVCVVYCY